MLRITSRQKSLRPAEYLVLASQSLTTLILHYFKLFTKFVVSCATAPLPPCPTSSQPLRTGSQPDSDSIPHASTLNFNAHSVQTLTCSHTRATPPRHCSQCRAGTATPTLKKKAHRRPLFAAQSANRSETPSPLPAASTVSVCNRRTATHCPAGSHHRPPSAPFP